jgi:hypothetical protein
MEWNSLKEDISKSFVRYVFLHVSNSSCFIRLAEEAAIKMVQLLGSENYNIQCNPGKFIIITEAVRLPPGSSSNNTEDVQFSERVLHFQCGNMFDISNIDTADIVMMETDIPTDLHPNLHRLISSLKEGSRVLTYLDLRRLNEITPLAIKQLDINRNLSDRYPTSWSVQRGHHFFLWQKVRIFLSFFLFQLLISSFFKSVSLDSVQ